MTTTFLAFFAPVFTTLGFAALLRAASALEQRVMDDSITSETS